MTDRVVPRGELRIATYNVHRPVDHALVQPVDGFDDGLRSVDRALAEGNSGSFSCHKLLNHDGHRAACHVQTGLLPVQQRTIRPERRPDQNGLLDDLVHAAHVDEGVVKSGERGRLRVLAQSGRANRDRAGEGLLPERSHKLVLQVGRQLSAGEQTAYPERQVPELLPAHVLEHLAVQHELDRREKARRLDEAPVGVGADRQSRGNGHTGPSQLPETCCLAAGPGGVLSAQFKQGFRLDHRAHRRERGAL